MATGKRRQARRDVHVARQGVGRVGRCGDQTASSGTATVSPSSETAPPLTSRFPLCLFLSLFHFSLALFCRSLVPRLWDVLVSVFRLPGSRLRPTGLVDATHTNTLEQ